MAAKFSNSVYRKAVAKIDRIFTWEHKYEEDDSTMWFNGEDSVFIGKPCRYWMPIVIKMSGKRVAWHCTKLGDVNNIIHTLELITSM